MRQAACVHAYVCVRHRAVRNVLAGTAGPAALRWRLGHRVADCIFWLLSLYASPSLYSILIVSAVREGGMLQQEASSTL